MKILLIGNPNVGKTTLFNALTGAHNRTGNYHGVTVGVSERPSRFPVLGTVCDLPGLYSLDGLSMEEKLAGDYIEKQTGEYLAVQVADAAHLKRSLKLTESLLARGIPVALAVTMCRQFRARGGEIDCAGLGRALGVKCFEVDALRKKSVKAFAESLGAFFSSLPRYRETCRLAGLKGTRFGDFFPEEKEISTDGTERDKNAGAGAKRERKAALKPGNAAGKGSDGAADETRTAARKEVRKTEGYVPADSRANRLNRLCLNGFFALPAFFVLAGLVFFVTFGTGMPGDFLKTLFEALIERVAGFAGGAIDSPIVRSLVCDGLIKGAGSVFSFIPQIALMYLFLDILEESGFMSALAFMTDGLFSKIGLSGRAAFSVLLGYGCTAAAVTSTRALEDKSIQRRAVSALYFVPCSAKLPVYLTLLSSVFENTFLGAVILYVLGTGMGLAVAAFLKKDDSVFLMELADICVPDILFVAKKLLFQIRQFIIKVSTTVLVFTLVVWFLSSFSFAGAVAAEDSFLAHICGALKYAFYPMGITDWRAAFAAVSGIIAKENIAGMIAVLFPEGFAFSFPSACAYLTFVALIPPCVSAITACSRELGRKTAWGYAGMQTVFAFACAYLVYFLLTGGAGILLTVLAAFGAFVFGRWLYKKINKKEIRKRKT